MRFQASLLAAALFATVSSLAMTAGAQVAPQRGASLGGASVRGASVRGASALRSAPVVCSAPLRTPVALTVPGVHATVREGLRRGLDLVDSVRVDVDGDGDRDVLALVDLPVDGDEDTVSLADPKPDQGRGVVVAFREARGYRLETVASLPRFPVEAGYNWGRVEARRDRRPVLHVHFSAAQAGRFERVDTAVRFDPTVGALRTECAPSHERAAAPRTARTRHAGRVPGTLARN